MPRLATARIRTVSTIRRGDIYLTDLDPALGAESGGARPVLVVSNDAANRAAERDGWGVVTVVPLTSNTSRVYPFQVLVEAGDGGLHVDSKAQAEQVRSVDHRRLRERIGAVAPATLDLVDGALRAHLGL